MTSAFLAFIAFLMAAAKALAFSDGRFRKMMGQVIMEVEQLEPWRLLKQCLPLDQILRSIPVLSCSTGKRKELQEIPAASPKQQYSGHSGLRGQSQTFVRIRRSRRYWFLSLLLEPRHWGVCQSLCRHLCPLWRLSTASLPDPLPEGALRSRSSLDTVQFMTDDSFLRNTVGDRIQDHFGGEPRDLCEGVLRQDYLKCEDPP